VKNVRNRDNASAYLGSEWGCFQGGEPGHCPRREILLDRFEDGMMTLPFIGFWLRF
jgi:hypothetical protein